MRTLLIDVDIPDEAVKDGWESIQFEATTSAFDFDAVVWDPRQSYERMKATAGRNRREGLPSLDDFLTRIWSEAIERRKREFAKLLEAGRVVAVLVSEPLEFFVRVGQKYEGTGKNRHPINLIDRSDLWSALPERVVSVPSDGWDLEVVNEAIRPLWKLTSNEWAYRAHLDVFPGVPLLNIRGIDLCAASMLRAPTGGLLLLLPEMWAEEGSYGPLPFLIEWIAGLWQAGEDDYPAWYDSYRLDSEEARALEISQLEEQVSAVTGRIEELQAEQVADQQWKLLVAGTDTPLELQCKKAFEVLGFEVLPSVPGRADLRLKADDRIAVVEVKGLKKSGAEKNAAQLEKWVAIELEADEVHAKGILVVNGWRELPPDERDQPVFPDQMIGYASTREHCLISGMQLLAMARAALNDPAVAERCRVELLQSVGRIEGWNDVASVFTRAEDNCDGDELVEQL